MPFWSQVMVTAMCLLFGASNTLLLALLIRVKRQNILMNAADELYRRSSPLIGKQYDEGSNDGPVLYEHGWNDSIDMLEKLAKE